MWRYWTDEKKTRGSFYISSKKDALKSIENEKASWGYLAYKNEYCFSEPEEYDDWSHLPSVDLELLNEAEEMLKPSQTTEYFVKLEKIVTPIRATLRVTDQSWHAKTPQRREALLKTLKLWED